MVAVEVHRRRSTYANCEQFMMAGKARLFDDDDALARILTAASPDAVKALGRQVRGLDEQAWAEQRYLIVVAGNTAKFSQDERLATYLTGTAERILVEASPVDRLWGIGLAATDVRASQPAAWRGQNLLGFALMDVRHTLDPLAGDA